MNKLKQLKPTKDKQKTQEDKDQEDYAHPNDFDELQSYFSHNWGEMETE